MARKRGLDHSVVETKQSKEQDEAIALLGKSWVEFCGLTCPIDSWLLGLARAHGLDASEYAIRQTGRKLSLRRRMATPWMPMAPGDTVHPLRETPLVVHFQTGLHLQPDKKSEGR